MPLLRTLGAMAAHEGPPNFFNFGGGANGFGGGGEGGGRPLPTGIACQGSIRPPPRGYTFAAWLRVENGRDAAALAALSAAGTAGLSAAGAGSAAGGGSSAGAAAAAGGGLQQRHQHVVAALLSRQQDALRGVGFTVEGA